MREEKNTISTKGGKVQARPGFHGGFQGGGEKPENFKKTWGELIAYSKPQLPIILVALLCAAIGALLSLVGPGKLSDITDLVTTGFVAGIDLDAVVKICVFLVVVYVASFVLSFAQGFILATVTQKITKKLRSDVSRKINSVPMWYYNRMSYGDVLSRVTNDVDAIGQTLNQSLGVFVSSLTLFLGSLVMMLLTNVILALSALVSVIIGFVLMILIMSKSQKYFLQQQRDLGAMNGHIEETYSGHDVVRAYNAMGKAKETFDQINGQLCESAFKSQFLSGLMRPVMMFIGNFGYVTVCVIGSLLAIKGLISFGVIVAFMMYVRFFTQPLAQLAQVATSLQSTAAASERVFEFLHQKNMEDESGKKDHIENVKGEIEFDHVRFGYEDSDTTVIHDLSLEAKPGQKVAIVGPTGAGKTTIVNLLMRFHEIQSGRILVDGVPIDTLTRENVHDLFCMVLQDTWLFEGTIRENIVYSGPQVSDDEMVAACKAVGIHHFIQTLPKGYDTVLTDESSLSAGQRQQLTIARAMVRHAPMLILDEATSSVDTRTELLIQQAMDKLMEGRTSFIIAHRLSTIKNADLILVLKDGDIIESGTHQKLLEQNGFYASLYNSQFEDGAYAS
ncbi:MAG: ABC transporter ATP-binding protein/permease [Spirochaetia bacterium]|jgi:ATP-binding cassette subfamily B protein|nr:ABC transporter ATP-binding protein/permease [Spirochaetia bacterium]